MSRHRGGRVFVVIALLYLCLILPTVPRHGISWDEQTDLDIASTYAHDLGGWLIGSPDDPANMRLPMYATAALTAPFGGPSLIGGRLASCAVGLLTLLGVFVYCRRHLGDSTAIVACLMLAVSPYFLAFSKVAFTEGDAFITCALVWVLVATAAFRLMPTLGGAAALGMATGLALSSKISAVAVLPVVGLAVLVRGAHAGPDADARNRRPGRLSLAAAAPAALLAWIALGLLLPGDPQPVFRGAGLPTAVIVHYAVALAVLLGFCAWILKRRRRPVGRWEGAVVVMGLAAATLFLVPPVHLTNRAVIRGLLGAFADSGREFLLSFAAEAAALHLSVVTIKSSPIVGVSLWVGAVAALLRMRRRPGLGLPLAMAAAYFVFLLRLPWAQTFHMMPVFALLLIPAADLWVAAWRERRAPTLAIGFLALAVVAHDFARSYPDLHLNGYQYTGARQWCGRPTIGLRSIAQLPPDGLQQAVAWVDRNLGPDDTLVTFLSRIAPRHIVNAAAPDRRFDWLEGEQTDDALGFADYVLTTLQATVREGFGTRNPRGAVFEIPWDAARLEAEFTRVFSVRRRFGLEVVSVWQRKNRRSERHAAESSVPWRSDFGAYHPPRPLRVSAARDARRAADWHAAAEAVQLRPRRTARRELDAGRPVSEIAFAMSADEAGAIVRLDVQGTGGIEIDLESDETRVIAVPLASPAETVRFRLANRGAGKAVATWTTDPVESSRWGASGGDPAAAGSADRDAPWRSFWDLARVSSADDPGTLRAARDWFASEAPELFEAVERLRPDANPDVEAALGVTDPVIAARPTVRIESQTLHERRSRRRIHPGPPAVRGLFWESETETAGRRPNTSLRVGTVWCTPGGYLASCRIRGDAEGGGVPVLLTVGYQVVMAEGSGTAVADGWSMIRVPFAVDVLSPVRFTLSAPPGASLWVDRLDLEPCLSTDTRWAAGRVLLAMGQAEDDPAAALDRILAASALLPGEPAVCPGIRARAFARAGDAASAAAEARGWAECAASNPDDLAAAAGILREAGADGEARDIEASAVSLAPAVPLAARFTAGVELVGQDPPPSPLQPGTTFETSWLWRRTRAIRSNWAAYVHYVHPSGYTFQDDHILTDSSGRMTAQWAGGAVVRDTRTVAVPPDAPPGTYEVRVGLVLPPAYRTLAEPRRFDTGRVTIGDPEAGEARR